MIQLFFSFQHFYKLKKVSNLWKFNNSLISNEDFIQKRTEMQGQRTIKFTNSILRPNQMENFEIWNPFTIGFSKNLVQLRRKEQFALENR